MVLPHLTRRVLLTCDAVVFARAMRDGLTNDALRQLDAEGALQGLSSCSDAEGGLLPGGVAFCYARGSLAKDTMLEKVVAADDVIASVVCVLSPAGLTVWAPKEEVHGILELIHSE